MCWEQTAVQPYHPIARFTRTGRAPAAARVSTAAQLFHNSSIHVKL